MRRPTWLVLAPGTAKKLWPTISKIVRHDPEDDPPWTLVDGKAGYVAIVDDEPGSDGEFLAKPLSKMVKKPVYSVIIDDDEGPSRVDSFVTGTSKGELKAGVTDVLFTLGFKFDWMRGGKKVALRTEAPMVTKKRGEAMIWNWSVSQWQQMKRKGGDWYMLLEGVGPKTIDQIIAICSDDDPEVRLLGVTMLDHVGYYGLSMEKRLAQGLAVLGKLADDRSKKVSKVAIETRDQIVERGEYESVREELPWILNYNATYLDKALALFDEDRPLVHRYLYQWLSHGAWNNDGLPKAAVAKLEQLAKNHSEAREILVKLDER